MDDNIKSITPVTPANFTPNLGSYTQLTPFRYWCQKVLPLVYDDSLSYYELLCKTVNFLNLTMSDVETLHNDVENLHTAYEELESYVNTYFESLDVQQEINKKLDIMANDGSLSALLEPLVSEKFGYVYEQLSTLISRMNTFSELTNGSTTGDAELTDIRVQFNSIIRENSGESVRKQVEYIIDFINSFASKTSNIFNKNSLLNTHSAYINSSGNVIVNENYNEYVVSDFIPIPETETTLSVQNAIAWCVAYYDEKSLLIERQTNLTAGAYTIPSNSKFLRLCFNSTGTRFDYEKTTVTFGGYNGIYIPYGFIIKKNNNDEILNDTNYKKYGILDSKENDSIYFPNKIRQTAWRGEVYSDDGLTIRVENSWSSYMAARENPLFDMLWIAVIQYSSNGTYYCFHDNQITIDGVTDEFYNFNDEQIQSVTYSDDSKIVLLTNAIKLYYQTGKPIGFRMGRLPNSYAHTLIGKTNLYRDDVWDNFIDFIKRWRLYNCVFSGSKKQCEILTELIPNISVQLSTEKGSTEAELFEACNEIKKISPRCSLNIYLQDLTESVAKLCYDSGVRIFGVTSEPLATEDEIEKIKELCPDYVITHQSINLTK